MLAGDLDVSKVVLASVDGDRVAHIVGWKSSTKGLSGIFNNFRRRADGVDGTPAALKESTHLYNILQTFPVTEQVLYDSSTVGSYPLISLDVFNNYRPDKHADMTTVLKELTSSPATLPIVTIPTFKSMHILSSTDSVVSMLLGVWKGEEGFPQLQNNDNYRAVISKAKKMSVRGTYSDLVKKIDDPSRLYYIVDFIYP